MNELHFAPCNCSVFVVEYLIVPCDLHEERLSHPVIEHL
jgi:hypothetical protein